jgi:hypothetical protein
LIEVLLVLPILVLLVRLTLTHVMGFIGTLQSQLERGLAPGEQSLYKSMSSRLSGFPLVPFALGDGVVMVTNKRLLWAVWILAPFWKRVKGIPLDRIEDVELNEVLSAGQVSVYVGGKRTIFMTRKNRWTPFSGDRGKGLTDAINNAKAAYR